MGLLTNLKDSISRVTDGLFTADEPKRIGIYGPPNAGKTTLANRIARDWTGDAVGPESHIPHETRDLRAANSMLIGIIESQDLPALILANKTDLPGSDVQKIANAFPQHETIPLSALEGENMDEVYTKIAEYFG